MMIPMSVGRENSNDLRALREGSDRVGFIRCIDDDAASGGVIADQVDVVVNRSNDSAGYSEPVSGERRVGNDDLLFESVEDAFELGDLELT